MEALPSLQFWMRMLRKKDSTFRELLLTSQQERLKCWKDFLEKIKLDEAQKSLLAEWSEALEDEKDLQKCLPYLFASQLWPLTGGGLWVEDLVVLVPGFEINKSMERLRKLHYIAGIHGFLWISGFDKAELGWRKFLETSRPAHSKRSRTAQVEKLVEYFEKIDKSLTGLFPAGIFRRSFAEHVSHLSMDQLSVLASKVGLFERVGKFLVVLPKGTEYAELRFHQELVLKNFQPDNLILNPEKSEGALLGAFWEYKSLYIEKYLEAHLQYHEWVVRYAEKEKSFRQKISALEKLDRISTLGKPVAPGLQKILQEIAALQKILASEPERNHLISLLEQDSVHCPACRFAIGEKFPLEQWEGYEAQIASAFRAKVGKLRELGAEKISRANGDSSARKLVDLLHVSEFDKLAKLLAEDSSGKITRTLKKIIS